MKDLLEIPLISATILDSAFSVGSAAIRKYRQTVRKNLDPGIRFSIGRAGTVQLNTVAALDCVATAGRWKARDADRLASVYKSAGLTKLVQSKKYGDALNLAREALQREVRSAGTVFSRANSAELISRCVARLTITEPVVRSVAVAMGAIIKKADAQLQQMKRLPGRIVRHDGPEALVVVDTGEREELRSVHSGYLKALGLQDRGAPFVLHELSWSPDTKVSVFFPALDLEEAAGASPGLKEQLKAAEQPLAEPSEIGVSK
ncbi:MAG: hypothetical protein HY235_01790 [Acidobacteria bacterium]|nr:hypothetical protein [Acidobacteriota bacterium]